MRLWSLHPKYLDAKGLVALWREGLLAKKVLEGNTKGYRNHPQLERFKNHRSPVDAISEYLHGVATEAHKRGYTFDTSKLPKRKKVAKLTVTDSQLAHEKAHLKSKLAMRDKKRIRLLPTRDSIEPHPLFSVVAGPVAPWEKIGDSPKQFPYKLDISKIDFRNNPEQYRVGRGEQGVLMVEPYKSEILPHWRFKTPEIAEQSAKKIFALFQNYKKQNDFVGMDMARKFLQMGYTRARRYANHKSGRKYDSQGEVLPQEKDWAQNEKAQSARLFYEYYIRARETPHYKALRDAWVKKHG